MDTLINVFEKKTKTKKTDSSLLHFHNGYELIFVTRGEVEIEIDCMPHKAQSNAIILLNPFEQHKITGESDDYERIVLVLNPDLLEQSISPRLIAMLKCRPQGFSHIIKPDRKNFENINAILNIISLELNSKNLFEDRYLLNCIYNLLILMHRTQSNDIELSPAMMKIQAYIDESYAQIESIEDIAKKFNISTPHLSRSFKKYSGYSPAQYLKNTRLYHAQQMLIYSDYRINEISHMVGFRETNNFIKQFNNKFGISPRQFKNNNTK